MNEEIIKINYEKWIDGLKKYGCYSELMINDLGELIKYGSFSIAEKSGSAYKGSLIDMVINHICKIAYDMNMSFGVNPKNGFVKHPMIYVNNNMLMRVLLLQHISKAIQFIPQPKSWKIKSGYPFDFNDKLITSLKIGERSIALCMQYGIYLSEEEVEALLIIDKDVDINNPFMSPLSVIVKNANHFALIEMRQKYLKEKNENTIEQ